MDTKKITLSIWLLIVLTIISVSCWRQSSSPLADKAQLPQRIVSISQNVTEILYGVSAWSQVVAVSQYCTYPEDVKNKPRVSGWDKTNLEQLTALRPDLVIGVDAQAPFLEDKLNSLGIRSLFVKTQTLADVYGSIGEIGRATGHKNEAAALVTKT